MKIPRLYLAFALSILTCCNYANHKDKRAAQKVRERQHKQYQDDSQTIATAEFKVRNSYDTIITVQHGYFHNDWICKKNGIYTLYESKLTYKLKPNEGYLRRPVKIFNNSVGNFDNIFSQLRQYRVDTISTNPKLDTTKYCDHCWGSTYIIEINNDTILNYYKDYRVQDTLHPKYILSKKIDEQLYPYHTRTKDAE